MRGCSIKEIQSIYTMNNITIKNNNNESLDFAFHEGNPSSNFLILIGHGVTGNKDRPFIKSLAEGLANAGFPTIRFSFSGNGSSEGKFEESKISKEVEDLRSVLDSVSNTGKTIIYAGHSMGGAVGVIAATMDSRINKLISLAGMVHTEKFCQVEFGDQIPGKGYMWDEQDCPLSEEYVEDMKSIRTVIDKSPKISIPWLLIHGTDDDVVPVDETHEIFEKAGKNAKKVILDGADHVFSRECDVNKLVEAIVNWLNA